MASPIDLAQNTAVTEASLQPVNGGKGGKGDKGDNQPKKMSEAELSKIAIKGALDIATKNFDMTHLEPNEKEELKKACKKMWIWLKKNLWDKGWIFDKKKGKFMLGEFGEFGNLGAAVKYYALHA